jgi:hypothetical protein
VKWRYWVQMGQTGTLLVLKGLHYEETRFTAFEHVPVFLRLFVLP